MGDRDGGDDKSTFNWHCRKEFVIIPVINNYVCMCKFTCMYVYMCVCILGFICFSL